MTEQTNAFNGIGEECERDHQQRNAPVHYLEQVVQDEYQGQVARAVKHFYNEA